MKCGVIINDSFALHRTPLGHPERPERIKAINETINEWEEAPQLERVPPRRASTECILSVHTKNHLQRIEKTAGDDCYQLDSDTYTSRDSLEVSMLAAGSAVSLAEALANKEIDTGFAIVRPPGHHAESQRAMGFCLFNNVAIAAEWAIRWGKARKVAIVDFDVHHGNGTQQIFYSRPDVLYISTHQFPFYPGTGHFTEMGMKAGYGFTVNFPISAGMGNYFHCTLYDDFVLPLLRQFQPEWIFISAGYDSHRNDPLGGMQLDANGFGRISNLLNSVAEELCEGRILYVLEGGYDVNALSEGVVTTLSTTLERREFNIREDQTDEYLVYRKKMSQALSAFWDVAK